MANEQRLIDADDLQRKLLGLADLYNVDYLFFDVVNDEIDNAPIVDAVEVVHGRWIKYKLGWDDFALRFKCSACDHRIYERGYNYCPNCGAKMDGERKDNES